MTAVVLGKRVDFARLADGLAVAVAVSLPWSSSATAILLVLWLLALLPTLDWASLRRELIHPAGGLPVLLFAIAALGTLWADVPWPERFGGLDSFARLLVIPLLFLQFRRSARGMLVLAGFLASCVLLLVVSFALAAWPPLGQGWANPIYAPGIPVKSYYSQSAEFVLCTFALAPFAVAAARQRRWDVAIGGLLLGIAFLANVFYVATARGSLLAMLVLFILFCLRQFTWKGILAGLLGALVLGGCVWASSPYLRARVTGVFQEVKDYQDEDLPTSSGQRLEYWKKSIGFIAEAPLIGRGTGSIQETFRRSTIGATGVAAIVSGNPHNQTLTVALQLGLLGTALLYAMWFAHLLLFRDPGLLTWIGLVIVVQNIVGSLFSSFLFDFTEGWIYAFGVGVTGGIVLRSTSPEQVEERRTSLAPATRSALS
ncbi:MAG: O-antigen ligase family protein [Xanthobacteraceae bacterium]